MAILAIALLALLSAIISSDRLRQATREQTLATHAARRVLERMRSEAFDQLYATYRTGGATGPTFTVEGLNAVPGGDIGTITFPEAGAPLQLCETVQDPGWDMANGRDLNGDGDAADANVSASYRLLPVRVTVRWQSRSGPTQVVVNTLITEK